MAKVRHTFLRYLGNGRMEVECPNGHRSKRAMVPYRRKPGESGYQVLASWWKRSGVSLECSKCDKERHAAPH